jgi:ketosteroid isomerase-like protein
MSEEEHQLLVRRLYEAFNRRDSDGIVAVCSEEMGFYPYATAEAVGRAAPYSGVDGLSEYMADIALVWEELQITSSSVERRGNTLLVRGRVYARSRELGIRDMPAAWLWGLKDGRFVRGEVFPDPEMAVTRFAALEA